FGSEPVPVKTSEYDKSKYSSETTSDYFENGWNELEIEGNDGIKSGIKNHILKVEKANEKGYKRFADEHEISVEEYKQKLQNHVEKMMSESDYFRATSIDILDKILTEDGRFKTLFE